MATPTFKLPPELYAKLLEEERRLLDFVPEFNKAEECGIECAQDRAKHAGYLELIGMLKQNYGPNSK